MLLTISEWHISRTICIGNINQITVDNIIKMDTLVYETVYLLTVLYMNGMINYDTIAGDNQFISVYHNIDSLTSRDTTSLYSIMEPRDLAFKYHNNDYRICSIIQWTICTVVFFVWIYIYKLYKFCEIKKKTLGWVGKG